MMKTGSVVLDRRSPRFTKMLDLVLKGKWMR